MADSSNRFWNPDSKEYPVDITLDHTPSGLKPGVTANVKIYVDRLHNVLAVPVSAVYAAGTDNYVFVRSDGGPKPAKVKIGEMSETHVQVASGISQGQQVLILEAGQGRDLLEKAGIKVEPQQSATTQPADAKHRAHDRLPRAGEKTASPPPNPANTAQPEPSANRSSKS